MNEYFPLIRDNLRGFTFQGDSACDLLNTQAEQLEVLREQLEVLREWIRNTKDEHEETLEVRARESIEWHDLGRTPGYLKQFYERDKRRIAALEGM